MQIQETKLPGVMLAQLKAFGDHRGFFREIYQQASYLKNGVALPFVQFNHSRSSKGILRGLHYQHLHPQGKLITVTRGAILDVVADIIPNSPTYGQWIAEEISDNNHRQLYVPPGYAHGFLTLSDEVDLLYGCTDYYYAEDSYAVNWNDPTLAIKWPIDNPILSELDRNAPFLADIKPDKLPTTIIL